MVARSPVARIAISTAAALCLCAGACAGGNSAAPTRAAEVREASDAQIAELTETIIGSPSELVYVSDYFSFVGQDEQGHVSFAIDNNRGRDGAEHQAEHFVVLHDEVQGFIDVPDFTRYPNPRGELRGIPDSERFAFTGARRTGLTIRGTDPALELAIEPIELVVGRVAGEDAIFYMGSAAATLRWNGRTLRGRVIEEYLVVKNWNRISRSDPGILFRSISFQGLYLVTPDAADLYVHRIDGTLAPTAPVPRLGFFAQGGESQELRELDFTVTRKSQGLGLFRWPMAWKASWRGAGRGTGQLEVEVVDFRRIGTYGLGGFGMAIAKGFLEQDGKRIPVYGWAELILWRA
jgi:hypothetical protein